MKRYPRPALLLFLFLLLLPVVASAGEIRVTGWTYTPAPLPIAGGMVTATATITAKAGLSTVNLDADQNGNHTIVAMSSADGINFAGTVQIPLNSSNASTGATLNIVVTDKEGTVKSVRIATQSYSHTPPKISNALTNPRIIPVAGGSVSVSAKVVDPALPLASVKLRATDRNGNYHEVDMSSADGLIYTASIPVSLNSSNSSDGTKLTITAVDKASNTSTLLVATQGFSNLPPKISNIVVTPTKIPAAGGTISVAAMVTDPALPLDSVKLRATERNGNYSEVAMSSTDGSTFKASIPVSLNDSNSAAGTKLTITAVDAASNSATALAATQGFSNAPPMIASAITDPRVIPIAGGTIKVSAKVTDPALPLSTVKLRATDRNGNYSEVAMSSTDGSTFTASIPVSLNDSNSTQGTKLTITAVDAAQNPATLLVATQGYSNTPPKISNALTNPRILPIRGTTAVVTARVTDPLLPLESVRVRVTDRNGNYSDVAMTSVDGLNFSATVSVSMNTSNVAQGSTVVVTAVDKAGNTSSATAGTQGFSNIPPSIIQVGMSPGAISLAGGTFAFTARITDPALPLSTVTLRTTDFNGNYSEIRMDSLDGLNFTGTITVSAVTVPNRAGSKVTITATDAAGNTVTQTVAVQPNSPP